MRFFPPLSAPYRACCFTVALTGLALPTIAAEFSFSGFGTVGYTISDQANHYQRFISNKGGFERDSLLGGQMDVQFNPQWRATVQARLSPSEHSDDRWSPAFSWAFLSYRPNNEWLFRLGKLRVPLYLNSESTDVGATFDFARLPTELYSISPTTDFVGGSVNRTWSLDNGHEVSLDGYLGRAPVYWRINQRDPRPDSPAGEQFIPTTTNAAGVALTYHQEDNTYLLAMHRADAKQRNGAPFPVTFPYVAIAPGMGYYQVSPALPGPGLRYESQVKSTIFNLGADLSLGGGYRLTTELARRMLSNVEIGPDTASGYLALSRRIDRWTPYVYYAFLRSPKSVRDQYQALNQNQLPAMLPGAAAINASQRAGADALVVYDQYSIALGTSYNLSTQSKLKAEWMQTKIKGASSWVDAPVGGNTGHQRINVYSLSYNFVF